MSSQNVAIRKDVYDALSREKRTGESFTQVLLRLLNQRGPLEELFGTWGGASRGEETALLRMRNLETSGSHRR